MFRRIKPITPYFIHYIDSKISVPQMTKVYERTSEEPTLESVALKLKSAKNNIERLSRSYENLQEIITKVMLDQKAASKHYKELKEQLMALATEECDDDCPCDDDNCEKDE